MRRTSAFEIELLLVYLRSGLPFQYIDSILKLKQNNLSNFVCNQFYANHHAEFKVISEVLNIEAILTMKHGINTHRSTLISEILKRTIYPLVLIALSLLLSIFCVNYLIPNISQLSFGNSSEHSFTSLIFICWTIIAVNSAALAAVTAILVIRRKKYVFILIYDYLLRSRVFSGIKLFINYVFAAELLVLVKSGLGTVQVIDILRRATVYSVSKWYAYEIFLKLEEGENLLHAFDDIRYDSDLTAFVKLGIKTDTLMDTLSQYLTINKNKSMIEIRRFSRFLQFISYVFIGLMIYVMFTVITIPMMYLSKI